MLCLFSELVLFEHQEQVLKLKGKDLITISLLKRFLIWTFTRFVWEYVICTCNVLLVTINCLCLHCFIDLREYCILKYSS